MTAKDITGWAADLQELTDGLGWLFNRPGPRVTFGLFTRALDGAGELDLTPGPAMAVHPDFYRAWEVGTPICSSHR